MFVVKVPGINGLGKTNGCERAGNEIIREFKNLHSNEKGTSLNSSMLDLEEIHLDNSNLELTNNLIYKNSLDIYEENPFVVFLGGDHFISYSTTKAFLDYCDKEDKKPCLIVFDAHADCMKPGFEQVQDSSTNDIKRMKEPTHEEWIRKVVEEGFPAKNILIIGARNIEKTELSFIRESGIKQISLNSILEDIDNIADTILEFCFGKEVYVSIDIDVVDPAFAPSTGYPEVGGLTSRQLLYLVQRIKKTKNLKAVDIVEINSEKDKEFNMITTKLGAKILGEFV